MTDNTQEQDVFLKCLLEANVDGIIAFDPEYRYTLWNRAMERWSGVKREDVLGKGAFELFPCLTETGEEKYYQAAVSGRTVVAETRPYNIPETGRSGFFDGYYSPRHDENGVVIGGVAIIRDVTDRKRAEATAVEAGRLAFHVENTPLAVIEWDADFRVLRWSPAAERLFGWTAHEVLGKRFSEWNFVVADDVEAVNEVGNRQNEGQEHHGISRNRNYTKVGSVVNCEWYNSALYDKAGKLISVLSLVLDVTIATRIEEALRKSETQYRLLFEKNPHAMWVYDLETHRFLAVNNAAIEHYGYSRAEFLAMSLKDIRPAEDVHLLDQFLATANPEFNRAGEWRHQKKDGTIINVEITSNRLDFEGKRAVFVLANDVTERGRAEKALRESEDRYRDLVDNSHELICTHDLAGRVISVNPWAARMLGTSESALVGMDIRDGLLPEYRDQFEAYLEEVKTKGSAKGVMKVRTSAGEIRLWEYYNTLRTQGVETPIVRGMAHDATERRKAMDREKEARLEAEAANRVKDEFLSTLSHELRTPLTAIMGWSNLLLHGEVEPSKLQQAVETIARNANSQCQLIDDLLEVSRIITGKLRLDFAACELQPVIEAALESVRPTAEAKGVQLQLSLDQGVGAVFGDSERLQQIVWNLLSNAVKFTPAGGFVKVSLQRVSSHVELSVADSGMGIHPDFLPHVFDRFRQADGSTTRMHGGLGLGLAIVRHLVELHGGVASASSGGQGSGSTFTVTLPLMVDPQLVSKPEPAVSISSSIPSTSLEGLKVLIVDDEADARELIVVMLSLCGANMKAAASSMEAMEIIENWRPQVVIADIGMPVEDGYGLIKRLRALPKDRGGDIPALALTAYARTEDRARALSAGYQVHLSKPVDRDKLVEVVAKLAERVVT
ncbi:MAG: hybrid sensor histidine kinase/response regulator [Acidobacteria bacterium]|nr:MAG: hybrid sensor histidine kinase/response regulator [Acidobacteriota bacterium]